MNKKYVHCVSQLIKVDNNLSNPIDFNGKTSPLSIVEQEEFLQKNYKLYKKTYGKALSNKVVSQSELDKLEKDFYCVEPNATRERIVYDSVKAQAYRDNEFENLILYSKKTKLVDDVIVFSDCDNYPMPCAKIYSEKAFISFDFSVNIDKSYKADVDANEKTTVTGRIISFRQADEEIFRLHFYSNGQVAVRLDYPDQYHPNIIDICEYEFDKEIDIKLNFYARKFELEILGEKRTFDIPFESRIDSVFLDGGMFPIGIWSLKPRSLMTEDGKELDIFKKHDGFGKNIEYIELGEKSLPFGLGTKEFKDCVLRAEFYYNYVVDDRSVFLNISTLDPDGEIYVNGRLVYNVCDFYAIKVDVTEFLVEGRNQFVVLVNPRAPQELFTWHKHKDPYSAWGIGTLYIEKTNASYIADVVFKTDKVIKRKSAHSITACADLSFNGVKDNTGFEIVINLIKDNKVLNVVRKPLLVDGNGKCDCEFTFEGNAWSTDNPNLYKTQVKLLKDGVTVDEFIDQTGFRTIKQSNGKMLLNGEDFIMKGGLLMQFLPPYENIPVNHVFPTTREIFTQALMIKKMNGNTARMHLLGYGSNDKRFARIFDKLGVTCIWTTRLIDSLSTVVWNGHWKQRGFFQSQMKEVLNHPSIVMWEGVNEIQLKLKDVANAYKEFVTTVKELDKTRLICPLSHVYYVDWYTDDGTKNKFGESVRCVKEWLDPLVVRSAHPYVYFLGYGFDWQTFRAQTFEEQKNLFESKNRAYIISEYAIMGRQNPNTEEAKNFINLNSYELDNEYKLGYDFSDRWELSQSYQALAAEYATKRALSFGADGLLWCCLTGGANDASYLKPIIDFYGYPKASFFALKNLFASKVCFAEDIETVWGKDYTLNPVVICNSDNQKHDVAVEILDESESVVFTKVYKKVLFNKRKIKLSTIKPKLSNGYYTVKYSVREI